MTSIIFVLIFYCMLSINTIFAARILCVSIVPSYSHQIVYLPIWKELAKRGHQVVSITPNPLNDPALSNLREIDISFAYQTWKEEQTKWYQANTKFSKRDIFNDYKICNLIFEMTMQHPEVQQLLNESFDLQIAEWVYPAVFGFSEKFHCPLITVGSLDVTDTISNDIGNPVNPVVYPNIFLPFTNSRMSFLQRLQSLEYSFWLRWWYEFQVYPTCDKMMREYFGPEIPAIKEFMKNISVNLINRNAIFHSPHLSVPNVVEFSGIHLRKPKELNEDVKKFLNEAPNGVVYFSFGTNVKSNTLANSLKAIIFATFKKLPYRVLLSYDTSNTTNLPENMKVLNWVSQEDVLSHKNIKVFITQGGEQSIEEAVRKRVPMIGIPFVLDQPRNVFKIVELGIGQYIDPNLITIDSFMKAILEVAENTTYRTNIETVAEILEDEPIPSLDKVIWWIEYTLRHNGTKHLKSPYLIIPWYQIYWLDVICFIVVVLFLIICLIIFIGNSIIRFILKPLFLKLKQE